jgi:hypothetical protein
VELYGKAALFQCARDDSAKFVTIAASLLPKQVEVDASLRDLHEMTEEQMLERIRVLGKELGLGAIFRESDDTPPGAHVPPPKPQ